MEVKAPAEVLSTSSIKQGFERMLTSTDSEVLGTWEYLVQSDRFIFDHDLRIELGLQASDELNLSDAIALIAGEDRQRVATDIQAALKFSTSHTLDTIFSVFSTTENKEITLRATGKATFDNAEAPVRLYGTLEVVAAAPPNSSPIKENAVLEKKFRMLADFMPQFVWTGDAAGNLNYFNQSVYDYSGLSVQQIASEGWLQIVHPDDREENVTRWMHSIQTGEPFLFEHRFRRSDGEYHWQLSRAIPQRDAIGKIIMWVGTSTDIETQKAFAQELEKQVQQRTAELEQKNKELQSMNAELQSFAYVSSHDLQEPLRKIQVFAAMLNDTEKERMSDTGKEYFRRLQHAAARMQTLIEDLLTYSRTNSTERIFETVNLEKIVEEVKADLKEDIQQKNAIVESTNLCDVNIIPFQFRQMLINLIGNALKFSKPGHPPHISVSRIVKEQEDNEVVRKFFNSQQYCHLSVSDDGIGFEPQYKERIFEVFQRLHGRSEYKGTGIGLAIVKKIVENHNGLITATGEVNKGARFDIYLPLNPLL